MADPSDECSEMARGGEGASGLGGGGVRSRGGEGTSGGGGRGGEGGVRDGSAGAGQDLSLHQCRSCGLDCGTTASLYRHVAVRCLAQLGESMDEYRRKHRLKSDHLRYLRRVEERRAKARTARQQQVRQLKTSLFRHSGHSGLKHLRRYILRTSQALNKRSL